MIYHKELPENYQRWHRWFAWYPVRVSAPSRRTVWLKTVYRMFWVGNYEWLYHEPPRIEKQDGESLYK